MSITHIRECRKSGQISGTKKEYEDKLPKTGGVLFREQDQDLI